MAEIGKDLNRAAALLSAGEVVAIPTETVYGLSGDATNSTAINKIYTAKNRPKNNPLIVHVPSLDFVRGYVSELPDLAEKLADKFWPGPLTMLLPKGKNVIDDVTAGLERVAVRMPAQPLTLELLRMLPFPLAAPSANPYGYISPTTAEHVKKQLENKIQYILDGGPCQRGIESTIVGFDQGEAVIYRKGVITPDDVKSVCGSVRFFNNAKHQHITSGMSLSHYSPKTLVYLVRNMADLDRNQFPAKVGIISFEKTYKNLPSDYQIILSPAGDLGEAAQHLYGAMYQLDQMKLDLIIAEMMPEKGIGIAINDRLTRASDKLI